MLITESFRAACVVGVIASAVVISLRAQEAPRAQADQEAAPRGRYAPLFPLTPQPDLTAGLFGPAPQRQPPVFDLSWALRDPQPNSTTRAARLLQQNQVAPVPQVRGDGPVCLRTVWVDPNIDPGFVQPVPEVGATIQRVVPPPCVQTTEPIVRP